MGFLRIFESLLCRCALGQRVGFCSLLQYIPFRLSKTHQGRNINVFVAHVYQHAMCQDKLPIRTVEVKQNSKEVC